MLKPKEQDYIRLLQRAAAAACAILCVDLGFVACASDEETVELVQLEEESPAGSSTASGQEGDTASSSDEAVLENQDSEEIDPAKEEETGTAALIYVYVCGAVASPGVYALPEGTRVYEAVAAAGGFASDADEAYVNQALILEDQDRLEIPTKEQTAAELDAAGTSASLAGSYGITAAQESGSASDSQSSSGLVNLNTASQAELETLPGIGEAKAKAIIAYREENGAFSSIEEIQEVSGIGEATYANLKDLITVD